MFEFILITFSALFFALRDGLRGYPEGWLTQNIKCWTFAMVASIVWLGCTSLSLLALLRDVYAWDKKVSREKDLQRLQIEERDLRWKIKMIDKDVGMYKNVSTWDDDMELDVKEVARKHQKMQGMKMELPRLKAMLAAMPLKIEAFRAKIE